MIKNLRKKGFTIVELVIVIAVIAILAAILIPTFSNVVNKASAAAIQSDLKNAKTQYLIEASDDKEYNPDLELVFKHTNDKGKVLYYLEEDGVYVPATGSNFEENQPKAGVYFVPLQYKSGTDEWLFAEFGTGTVGVIAYAGRPAAVASYGAFVEIIDSTYTAKHEVYGNVVPPIWKATDAGFELSGELTYHNLEKSVNTLGFDVSEHWFLSFSIKKPENVVLNDASTIQINNTIWGGQSEGHKNLLTEMSDGSFDCIWGIQAGENLKVTIDWDGTGTLFAPQSYVIDVSKLTFNPTE